MSNLTALLGSRICHDLINPLGAIGNGIELLELAGLGESEELHLVRDSVNGATAKLKFLRLAFGLAAADQVVGRNDILPVLETLAKGGRLSYSWNVAGTPARRDVRAALLSVMCLEAALPVGGDINITLDGSVWSVSTRHDRLNLDPALWVPLSKGTCPANLTASQVQFGLLPEMTREAGRSLALSHGVDWVKISF